MRPQSVILVAVAVALAALGVTAFLGLGRVGVPEQIPQRDMATSSVAQPHSGETNQETLIAQRLAELQDLAYENDSNSLDKILAELKNRSPEIRKAAVEAAIQFGSRDAIPKLREAAAQATNREEKVRLLDAAEFLKLPSLTEVLARTNQPGK